MNENKKRTVIDRALVGATVALLVTGVASAFVGVYALVSWLL